MNADTNEVIITMVDDGQYSQSGDDIKNDGVYSCKIEVDNSEAATLSYYVLIEDEDGTIYVSNTVSIKIYRSLTAKDLSDMKAVDNAVQSLYISETYQFLSFEEKCDAIEKLLYQLASIGTDEYPYSLIQKDTISFNGKKLYSFKYACGASGTATIEDFVTETTSTTTSVSTTTEQSTTTTTIVTVTTGQSTTITTDVTSTQSTKTTTTTIDLFYGDINDDGVLSVIDVVMLQKYILAISSFQKSEFEASDMNQDNKVNVFDLCLLKRELLKDIKD